MKKMGMLCVLTLLVGSWCFAADVVEGYWLSIDEKTGKFTAGWEIKATNGVLEGHILSIYGKPQNEVASACKVSYAGFPVSGDVRKMKVVGEIPWIFGMKMDRAGQWSGGKIINPEDGNMYTCKITFHQADGNKYKVDTLEVRGELFLGIGRSQFWQKATRIEASSLR
ncbi:hypothetical protein FACS1894172_02130 [Spirochaetia bacterium]|nr:hypothetical protein FACS1894164_04320 [Spirochaetia bacterium]GHU29948.1 hypothetical protein FACS1894172_02130 [Spirochaetia bacterium]